VSSERGRDPRGFSLLVFGGAGALHGASVAKSMGMKDVIVAPLAGVFSAFGLLCADIQRIYVNAFDAVLDKRSIDAVNKVLQQMIERAVHTAREHGYSVDAIQVQTFADLRYRRQQSELTLPLCNHHIEESHIAALEEAFHAEYESTFGFRLSNTPVEIVNLRVSTLVPIPKPRLTSQVQKAQVARNGGSTRKAFFGEQYGLLEVPVKGVSEITAEGTAGPVLIDTYDSKIVVPPESHVRQSQGNLVIDLR